MEENLREIPLPEKREMRVRAEVSGAGTTTVAVFAVVKRLIVADFRAAKEDPIVKRDSAVTTGSNAVRAESAATVFNVAKAEKEAVVSNAAMVIFKEVAVFVARMGKNVRVVAKVFVAIRTILAVAASVVAKVANVPVVLHAVRVMSSVEGSHVVKAVSPVATITTAEVFPAAKVATVVTVTRAAKAAKEVADFNVAKVANAPAGSSVAVKEANAAVAFRGVRAKNNGEVIPVVKAVSAVVTMMGVTVVSVAETMANAADTQAVKVAKEAVRVVFSGAKAPDENPFHPISRGVRALQ